MLDGLTEAQRNSYIRRFSSTEHGHFEADELIARLREIPQMLSLAANPLLLSIICSLVKEGPVMPATRTQLYNRALTKLLDRPRRRPVKYPNEEPPRASLRAILERAALVLSVQARQNQVGQFPESEVVSSLAAAAAAEGIGPATDFAHSLLRDLTHNSGLLRGRSDRGYFFLHPTFQEFLSASALARILKAGGWNSEITFAGTPMTVRELVDRKAWDPGWQEVLKMLAGQLEDPTPLLAMLSNPQRTSTNPKGDDIFRHRLTLAACCLTELPKERLWLITSLIGRITAECLCIWSKYHDKGADHAIAHIAAALPGLARVNGPVRLTIGRGVLGRFRRASFRIDQDKNAKAAPVLEWLSASATRMPA